MILALLCVVLADDAFRGARDGHKTVRASARTVDELKFSIIRLQAITSGRDLLRPWMHGMGLGGLGGLLGHMHHGAGKTSAAGQPGGMPGGMEQSVGSGFVVRDDEDGPLIVTNAHVVSDAPALAIQIPAGGQQQYEARVVLVNHDMDIALVKVVSKEEVSKMREDLGEHKLVPVDLYDGRAKVGMTAVAMGFPLGMTSVKVSTGVLSGHETVGDFIVYQHTSPISPGNSGGPLFVEGTDKVLGINFATASGASSQQNNFAIPSWRVQQMLTQYEKQEDEAVAEEPPAESEEVEKESYRSEDQEAHERERKTSTSAKSSKSPKKAEEPVADDLLAGLFQGMGMSLAQKKIDPESEEKQLEMPDQDFSSYGVFSRSKCMKDRGACEFKVPRLNAEMTTGTENLYKLYGCESGILVSRVSNNSYLARADPPIQGKAFITKINGVQLDRFGMGHAPTFFDDPVGFADLLFSRKDLSEAAEIETCSCGKLHTHTVSLQWSADMAAPVPMIDEPAFAHLDYEQFGEVTITPLTMNVASQLMQMGRVDLLAYLVDPNPEAALVITDVDQGDSSGVGPGAVVAKMNGHQVKTLSELRANFMNVHPVNVSCGMEAAHAEGGTDPMAALFGGQSHKQHKNMAAHKMGKKTVTAWVIETSDGENLVQPYETTLEEQRTMVSEGVRPLTPAVRAAIKQHLGAKEESGEESEESGGGGILDLLGLFNILGGSSSNETGTAEAGAAAEPAEEPAEGEEEVDAVPKHHKKKPETEDEKGEEAVNGAEEGEETVDEAAALTEAARLVARRLALTELLAKVPAMPVEQRKTVRRGGASSF